MTRRNSSSASRNISYQSQYNLILEISTLYKNLLRRKLFRLKYRGGGDVDMFSPQNFNLTFPEVNYIHTGVTRNFYLHLKSYQRGRTILLTTFILLMYIFLVCGTIEVRGTWRCLPRFNVAPPRRPSLVFFYMWCWKVANVKQVCW